MAIKLIIEVVEQWDKYSITRGKDRDVEKIPSMSDEPWYRGLEMSRKRVFLESITEDWSKKIGSEIHFPNGGKNMASNDAQRLNNPRPSYKNRSLLLSVLYRRWQDCIVILNQFFKEIIFFFLLWNLLNVIDNKEYKIWRS